MKRSEYLKPLSWEHHDGLVSVFRLREGLKKQAELKHLLEYVLYIWEQDLSAHFEREEIALIGPALRASESQRLLEQFQSDHEEIRGLVTQLQQKDGDLYTMITQFTDQLEKHIRFEEREFFPFIEKFSDYTVLAKIGLYIKENHQPGCKTWKPEFWK